MKKKFLLILPMLLTISACGIFGSSDSKTTTSTITTTTTTTVSTGTYTSNSDGSKEINAGLTYTITLSANKSATTYYSFTTKDGDNPTSASSGPLPYTSPLTVKQATVAFFEYVLTFHSVDSAGNVEADKTETYKIVCGIAGC